MRYPYLSCDDRYGFQMDLYQMLLHVPNVLSKEHVKLLRTRLDDHDIWISGQQSAGAQAKLTKRNKQVNPQHLYYKQLNELIYPLVQQNLLFQSFCLPKHLLPFMFNCYQDHDHYGNHVDSAIQRCALTGQTIRTDLSMTLFLSEPDEYTGGELIIDDTYGTHEIKLDAGDLVLYPATSLHRVEAVTSGKRFAAFSWAQSLIKEDAYRSMLFQLDLSIIKLREKLGEDEDVVHLTQHYHNLIRTWAEL